MNLRMSFSFSIVFHLLAFALLLAAAQNQQILPAGSWPVQLTVDEGMPAAKSSAAHTQPPAAPVTTEMSDAMPQEIPAEESVPEPDQTGTVEEAPPAYEIPPLLRRPEPDMQLAIMHHRAAMSHAKMYILTAGSTVTGILEKILQGKKAAELAGLNAKVMLRYGADGSLADAVVSADSGELRALLEPVNWRDFPLPFSYSLRLSGLDIEIAMDGSGPKISFVTYF